MVMEGERPLGGERTVRHTDEVLWSYTPGASVVLLTDLTPMNLTIKKE